MTAGPPPGRPGSDPEKVLSQALRAMAGGRPTTAGTATGTAPQPVRSRSLSPVQILLIAAIVGAIIGMGAGLLTIL